MTERRDAPSLLQQVRAHAKARDSIAWSGQARQLLLWAADTIEAANAALSETAPTRDAALEEAAAHIESHLPYSSSIGPLHSAGLNEGVRHAANNIRALKSAAPKGPTGGNAAAPLSPGLTPAAAASPACASPNSAVLSEVNAERERQDEKWGGAEHDDSHDTTVFVQLIEDYAGWARVMAGRQNGLKARRRLIQVAALAVAAVESIDRRDANWNEHG